MKKQLCLLMILLVALTVVSAQPLNVPPVVDGHPMKGVRVKVIPPEYEGTDVCYSLFLPDNYSPSESYPVIVEYTGNYWPPSGSTGEVKDANLGYAIAKKLNAIWLVMPYVKGDKSVINWWGSEDETTEYALKNIRRVCMKYHGNPAEVFICGFSRGAIGVNYLGLHNDEIADVWLGFFTHDHYDGAQEWRGKYWGTPLADYRQQAKERIQRMSGRAALVSNNTSNKPGGSGVPKFLKESGSETFGRFTYLEFPITDVIHDIPSAEVPHPHTDKWLLYPSEYANVVCEWFKKIIADKPGTYSVAGRVTDEFDNPIGGIIVESGRTHFDRTDKDGRYKLEGLTGGNRTVQLSDENGIWHNSAGKFDPNGKYDSKSPYQINLKSDLKNINFTVFYKSIKGKDRLDIIRRENK